MGAADQELTEIADVVEYLGQRLATLDADVEGLSQAVSQAMHDAEAAVAELAEAVNAFFDALRAAVDHRGSTAAAAHYGQAVLGMRRIADVTDRVAAGASPDVVHRVKELMRHLIDQSYLKAANPELAIEELEFERGVVGRLVAAVATAASQAPRLGQAASLQG